MTGIETETAGIETETARIETGLMIDIGPQTPAERIAINPVSRLSVSRLPRPLI